MISQWNPRERFMPQCEFRLSKPDIFVESRHIERKLRRNAYAGHRAGKVPARAGAVALWAGFEGKME